MNDREAEREIYFRIHMLLVAIGVCCYSTAIGWLTWRIVVGGGYELALGLVVIAVLLCVMLTACGCAAAIALDGRKEKKVKPASAQPRVISANQWTIRRPLERRGPF